MNSELSVAALRVPTPPAIYRKFKTFAPPTAHRAACNPRAFDPLPNEGGRDGPGKVFAVVRESAMGHLQRVPGPLPNLRYTVSHAHLSPLATSLPYTPSTNFGQSCG